MCVHTLLYTQARGFSRGWSKFIMLKCNFSMNKGEFSCFQGLGHTLHQNTHLSTLRFHGNIHETANKAHPLENCVHYGVIRCFVGLSARKRQLFHPFHFPCLTEPKFEDFPPKNEQRHPAKAECRLFVCCLIPFDRCRFRNSFKLLSYQHPQNGPAFLFVKFCTFDCQLFSFFIKDLACRSGC